MQKLISELTRLYLPDGGLPEGVLARHVQGQAANPVRLAASDGRTRALAIPFPKMADGEDTQHWSRLCEVANALQIALGFPAPAVSISGENGFALWLSLEKPIAAHLAQQFLALLRQAYFPDIALRPDAASAPLELPPGLHPATGKWAAFINPGLGASFADESGLEMAPPFAGQTALLQGLQRIGEAQFLSALDKLRQAHGAMPAAGDPAPQAAAAQPGLLLKDATLEDIVRFLHAKNIEPTFRHLLPNADPVPPPRARS
ncbi:hypothetical protein LJR289_001407 [Pseudoduganella sp. LjRoot289]|uniref:hypothetical protein n=1 Tax=Pseudoduganella sp. LjRoot289 TaxID=3342314 RepID=UPI003ECD946D